MSIGPYRILKKFTPNPTHFWEVSKNYPELNVRDWIEMVGFKIEEKIFTTVNPTELFLICEKEGKQSSEWLTEEEEKDCEQSLKEIEEGKSRRFSDPKEAIKWLDKEEE